MANLNVCRLCLTETEDILIELTKDDATVQTIFTLTSLQLLPPDAINPVFICTDCQSLLEQFAEFRSACLKNDELYHKLEAVKLEVITLDEAQALDPLYDEEITLENEKNILVEEVITEEQTEIQSPSKDAHTRTLKRKKSKPISTKKRSVSKTENTAVHSSEKQRSTSSGNRLVPCVQCGKMIVRSNMKKHLDTHNPTPPKMFCSHCGKSFKDVHLLNMHVNGNHTFEKKYDCKVCGKVYFRSNSLREHVLANHSTEKRYECGMCSMKFSNYAKKNYHFIKMHTVAKPFNCQFCDKAFKMKSDLTLHTRTHTGEKPFSCDICGKRFNKSYNVVIHKKSHQNNKAIVSQKTTKAEVGE
ncbi:zinc finger protein 681-like [Anopheles nili]|uniref:zinc finger protein 681-like n=1 Tax=Anopheles nili TaxID=185578 RepID=UPI00237C3A96|nr:zinc finger protein 681-like [Anopheles nili]